MDQIAVLSVSGGSTTHCGMNSVSEALYFRVPLVLFPQTPEQDAVARRTEELGAGVRLKSISEEDILDALREVPEKPACREGAGRVSDSFKASGGVSEAVAFLERVGTQAGRKERG